MVTLQTTNFLWRLQSVKNAITSYYGVDFDGKIAKPELYNEDPFPRMRLVSAVCIANIGLRHQEIARVLNITVAEVRLNLASGYTHLAEGHNEKVSHAICTDIETITEGKITRSDKAYRRTLFYVVDNQ